MKIETQRNHLQVSPVAITIGGSDGSGGAGIQADLRALSVLGVEGLSVISAIVVEDTREVSEVAVVEVSLFRRQLEFLLERYVVKAIKIGLLPSAQHIQALGEVLEKSVSIPVVIDPVLKATAGDFKLTTQDAIQAYREKLIPQATMITPNRSEAIGLLEEAKGGESQEELASHLARQIKSAVYLKGGHFTEKGDRCQDVLACPEGELEIFSSERLEGESPHGTGCVIASAIAANLAKGMDLKGAVETAHGWFQAVYREAKAQAGQRPTLLSP